MLDLLEELPHSQLSMSVRQRVRDITSTNTKVLSVELLLSVAALHATRIQKNHYNMRNGSFSQVLSHITVNVFNSFNILYINILNLFSTALYHTLLYLMELVKTVTL